MKAEDRRQMILECSKKLFSKKGYFNTQISDIVKKANIARGTVYQYFKNKDDIFITILEDGYSQWRNALEDDTKDIDYSRISLMEYSKLRLKSALYHFAKDRELSNITLRMAYGLPENLVKKLNHLEKNIIDHLISEITLGIEANLLRKDLDSELTANLIHGAISRVAYSSFVQKKLSKKDIDKLTDEIIDFLDRGIYKH